MIAVNYTNLRDNLKSYCDKVNHDFETVVVTRKNNRNVVILSEESYNNMLENIYIRSSNINNLIKDIERNGNEGIGKPESLKGDLSRYWSRRINDKDRLIYKLDNEKIYILACRTHYQEH